MHNHAIKLQKELRAMDLDRTDRKLLSLLQIDASRTNAALADLVNLSPSSCLRRIRRLKEAGIIERVVALLAPAKTGRSLKAFVTVGLERHSENHMRQFLDAASSEPAVVQAYTVSGETDAILMLRLAHMEEYDALCERLFKEENNVARYTTSFVIRTAKETTRIPL
jgi:Lrp/AsnC family transcriptional regulator, leucine-responsive regulatory protein